MRGKAQPDGRPAFELIETPTYRQLWTKVHVHYGKLKPALAPLQYVLIRPWSRRQIIISVLPSTVT